MNSADRESLLHRRLARLPPPRAPETLLPRVLAAVRRPRRPAWYASPWTCWSRTRQVVSVLALIALVRLAWTALDRAAGAGAAVLLGEAGTGVAAVAEDAVELERAVRVLWRLFLEPNVRYLVAAIGAAGVAGALFCAALARVLREGSVTR